MNPETQQIIEGIVRFITRNSFQESRFLTPFPEHLINSESVIDHILEATDIPKEQLSVWSNDEADKMVREKA